MKPLLLLSLLVFSNSFAADTKNKATAAPVAIETEAAEVVYPESADIRCEKLTGHTLSDFKKKLVETCDLNKPFSSSLNRILNDDTYLYCCHLRK